MTEASVNSSGSSATSDFQGTFATHIKGNSPSKATRGNFRGATKSTNKQLSNRTSEVADSQKTSDVDALDLGDPMNKQNDEVCNETAKRGNDSTKTKPRYTRSILYETSKNTSSNFAKKFNDTITAQLILFLAKYNSQFLFECISHSENSKIDPQRKDCVDNLKRNCEDTPHESGKYFSAITKFDPESQHKFKQELIKVSNKEKANKRLKSTDP